MAGSGAQAIVVVAAVIISMVFAGGASAATYIVGEPAGSWDLTTNYANWVANKRFHPDDTIVFKYSPQAHDVLEVSKAAYESCSTSNSLATHNSGNDTIALSATGTRYFICGFPSHCTAGGGMKIKIDVTPSSSSTPAPAGAPGNSPPPPPRSPSAATSVSVNPTAALLLAASLMVMA